MDEQNLIRMANQIAAFFEPYSHEEGVAGTAEHIGRFWEPRMRRALYELLDRGGEGLSPMALEAARRHRETDTAGADSAPHTATSTNTHIGS